MAALFAAICDQSLFSANIITEGDAANVLNFNYSISIVIREANVLCISP